MGESLVPEDQVAAAEAALIAVVAGQRTAAEARGDLRVYLEWLSENEPLTGAFEANAPEFLAWLRSED